MDKLFSNSSLFHKIMWGKYFLPFAFICVTFIYIIPWGYLYKISFYKTAIDVASAIYPNIGILYQESAPEARGYLIGMWVFTNFAGSAWFVISILKVRPSDRVINGTYRHSAMRAAYAVVAGVFLTPLAIFVATSTGLPTGPLGVAALDSTYKLVLFRFFVWWCAIWPAYGALSIVWAYVIKIRQSKERKT